MVLFYVLAALGISILVIVHEAGHYLIARAFGMRVTRFSVGFGPPLLRYRRPGSDTTFQVCAIPFLAYVQIAGMNPHEDVDPRDPALFPNKGVFARIAAIAAGPLANYLAASLLVFSLAVAGWPEDVPTEPMVVRDLTAGMPAAEAGLRPGDVIRRANGVPIRNVGDLIAATSRRAGKATVYEVEREGRTLPPTTITPVETQGRGIIGVEAQTRRVYKPMALGDALEASVVLPLKLTLVQIQGMIDMARRGSTKEIAGPVGMGKIVAERAAEGPAEYVLVLVLLSVALGLFNLLPFPALDGGRLVFLAYEVVARRRPNERIEALVHTVGLVLLLSVLVLVTYRDVVG